MILDYKDREKLREVVESNASEVAPPGWPYVHVKALAKSVLRLEEELINRGLQGK